MRTPSALVSLSIVMAATTASHAGFTGFTSARVITAAGNTQYSIYANFDSVGLPSGKSWVFLNAYNYQGVSGSMNARHQDAAEDADGNPTCSWDPRGNLLGFTARENDSWVTASGSGSGSANGGTCLDATEGVCSELPNGSSWWNCVPGLQSEVPPGGASGFRIKLIQIVRTGNDNFQGDYVGSMFITYKVQDTSAPLTGSGSFNLVPAPGAIALAGLAGLTGRRRR
jgi:hypothetical protein